MELLNTLNVHSNESAHDCNATKAQPWLSQGTLDVLVIFSSIRTCTLDAFVILSQGFALAAGPFGSCGLLGCCPAGLGNILIGLAACWLVGLRLFGFRFISFFSIAVCAGSLVSGC